MVSPRVSLVMPCFQQTAFLEEAVRSVLDQREVDVELLVMDPGSTDGSHELLAAISVRLLRTGFRQIDAAIQQSVASIGEHYDVQRVDLLVLG